MSFYIKLTILLILIIFAMQNAEAKLIKVAVLDTGYNFSSEHIPLCGIHNFSDESNTQANDVARHGANVVSLIAQEAGPTGYCIYVLKVFNKHGKMNISKYVRALNYALTLNVDIVNLSISEGAEYGPETEALKKLLDRKVRVVVAAGNGSEVLKPGHCTVYPACVDQRLIVVGNRGSYTSNRGPLIDLWINGNNRRGGGTSLSGTSQAAAIATGRLVRLLREGYKP